MKTIFRKSFSLLLALVLGISICFSGVVLFFMNTLYYEINTRNLEHIARVILNLTAKEIESCFFPEFREASADGVLYMQWEEIMQYTPYRITLITPDGQVLADSLGEAETFENHRYRPEVEAALSGKTITARRISRSFGEQRLYTALPVRAPAGDTILGVFRLSLSIPSFWSRVAPGALPFLLAAVIMAAVAAMVVYAFSRSLSVPASHLADIAAAATRNNPDPGKLPRPAVSDIREFQELDTALRSMLAELRQRIEKAEAQGLRLEAILNGMTEAVFAIDEKLRIHLANPAARRLFDIREAEDLLLIEATRSSALEECAQKALESGISVESELTIHQNGGTKYFQVFAAPLPGSGSGKGNLQGLVMVLSDVTRIRRLETVRKDFVANVSHELRTPIQLVKGFSENLLETDFSDQEQTRRFLEIISRNARRMEDLTEDLLLLMNLESGDSPGLVMEATPLKELLSEAAGIVQSAAAKKGITIIISCPENLIARVNSSFLIQGVFNLLDNGVKYSPPDTTVYVRAEERALDKSAREIVIEVADQGPGIAPEHLERIFERFYRVDRSRSREAGGTGLGLSIVRHIALLHGGSAEAESHVGEGSVFRIRLPRQEQQ
ncbi:MAG: PAS domain-containing protein [Spirochaetaceae bacterium]|jgi:two-component system phosphate regulon sensor histidine kinase PhoR|nr:PAS domain-containing protein [Spirochaetaceae bacterium]